MTVGEFLRRKREERKITLEQVAADTNIRIKFLQAIEDDHLEMLPSISQAKGFIRLYAAFLGLDSRQIFEEVEKANQPIPEAEPAAEPTAEPTENIPQPLEVETPQPKAKPGNQRNKKPQKRMIDSTVENDRSEPKPRSQIIFDEIGRELQKQREALGLSRADVERQIKIREFFIFSLEKGQIDNLPSTVQGRGMLNNYASFMNLDAEALQMRYAEGLQKRREEKHQIEEETRKKGVTVLGKEPLSGWRRVLTPDLLVGGSVFIVLFALIVWGAIQVIHTSLPAAEPTNNAIDMELTNSPTPSPLTTQGTGDSTFVIQSGTPQEMGTTPYDFQSTLAYAGSGPIQLVVVAHQRAYMKITVDGKEAFSGRVVPGNVYTYSGKIKIILLTGNGAALEVYYNQQDEGVIGQMGQVVQLEFTTKEMVTSTPQFTTTPTLTQLPTLTAQPTKTPLPSATVPTATITPVRTLAQ